MFYEILQAKRGKFVFYSWKTSLSIFIIITVEPQNMLLWYMLQPRYMFQISKGLSCSYQWIKGLFSTSLIRKKPFYMSSLLCPRSPTGEKFVQVSWSPYGISHRKMMMMSRVFSNPFLSYKKSFVAICYDPCRCALASGIRNFHLEHF